jgi:hypothetical protein
MIAVASEFVSVSRGWLSGECPPLVLVLDWKTDVAGHLSVTCHGKIGVHIYGIGS